MNCSSQYSSFCPYYYSPIFIQYCGNNSSACVVNCCRRMAGLSVVFCAHFPLTKTFMPLLNSTSVQYCISTNLVQWSINDGDCIATQSFNLDVCTLFELRNMSWEIFYFIFGQLWHCKTWTKHPQKSPRSLRNSLDYTLLAKKKQIPTRIFPGMYTMHYFWNNPRIKYLKFCRP